MQFVQSNWEGIVLVLTSAVALASAVAALTPTPKDDGIVKKLYALIDTLALNVGKAKEK
jgi:hypothetical protein|tara:strand:- start:412 stop:588 length:177 start_codon:yes stop_codon:yes gene_type:complete